MGNLAGFNAAEVEPTEGFELLPNGEYTAVITESEMKETAAGNGTFLSLTFKIIDGEFKGRRLWENLNLDNPNEKAVQIARGTLSAICRAVGVETPDDSVQLHDIPMVIKVAVRKRKDTGEMQNRIVKFSKTGGTQATSKPTSGAAPWSKKVI